MKNLRIIAVVGSLALLTSSFALAQPEGNVISQKKRKYAPGSITIKVGETIKILNDDMFLHHAFIESGPMKFDSGSMEEGDAIAILFKQKGAYDVLCAIHPKMKLSVTVE